jgi:hypothetical protein
MPEMRAAAVVATSLEQAIDLSLLVDLEARWENLRKAPPPEGGHGTQDLQGRQRAYDAYRAKLGAYNKRYAPAHVPELLLNTPSRLGAWCRAMRDLYLQVEQHPRGHCPAHLLEKAYRQADRVGARLNKEPVRRSPPPGTIRAAVLELEALGRWCDGLVGVPGQSGTPSGGPTCHAYGE